MILIKFDHGGQTRRNHKSFFRKADRRRKQIFPHQRAETPMHRFQQTQNTRHARGSATYGAAGFIASVIGAILLLVLYGLVTKKR